MDLLQRPAPKQRATVGPMRPPKAESSYNIWYGKKPNHGHRPVRGRDEEREQQIASTRCRPKVHTGYTRAGPGEAICVFFAQGRCDKGAACEYHHRCPTPEDEQALGPARDVFGRERFAEDRDDMGSYACVYAHTHACMCVCVTACMLVCLSVLIFALMYQTNHNRQYIGGIGSFSRENRTLYVGRVPTSRRDLAQKLEEEFGEFGAIEKVKVLKEKGCAFVKYRLRSAAEFAKEAMACQTLYPGDECINLRWATEDPNPGTKKKTEKEAFDLLHARLEEKGVCVQPSGIHNPAHYQLPTTTAANNYPDTDAQFPSDAKAGRVPPPPAYSGKWATSKTEQGLCYYYNVQTNETAWELPAGAIEVHVNPTKPSYTRTESREHVDSGEKVNMGDGLAALCGYGDDSDGDD